MKEYDTRNNTHDPELSDSDSGLYTDHESARHDLAGIFSNSFSNISPLYLSGHGATEIHSAMRYGKRFVLKGLRQEHRDDPVFNMCMAKEFEIGITLDHPNIRRTIGLEEIEGLGRRIILEYVDGITLADRLSTGGITSEKALTVATQIADALGYLHSKRICHRDLKPENVLIPYQGDTIKLIDFNLSDGDDYVVLKNPAGSKRYMAPELNDPDSVPTPETDCYSFGVILKDLAEASGNRQLKRAAERCMDPDPQKRREGLLRLGNGDDLQNTPSLCNRILSSRALTYILSTVCILLSAFITRHYFQ